MLSGKAETLTILRRLSKEKSKYFNYLSHHQVVGKRIVPCKEFLRHTASEDEEDAFIFTLPHPGGSHYNIVFENINPARATIIFEVAIRKYTQGLLMIYNFMRSNEINKRLKLHNKKFDFKRNGIFYYVPINHTTFEEWKENF